MLGEHHLIVHAYDYAVVERFVSDFCAAREAETWERRGAEAECS